MGLTIERPKEYNLEFSCNKTGQTFFGRRVESGQYKLINSASGEKTSVNQRTIKEYTALNKRPQKALKVKQ